MKPKSRERVTERPNPTSTLLDTKRTREVLSIINREDQRVAPAVRKTLPQIARAVDLAVEAISKGGRVVYLGAGTSGRMGALDAAETLPTFGSDRVVAVVAGAPASLTRPVEGIEDDPAQAARDLKKIKFGRNDLLVGISASGAAPYVTGGMRYARRRGANVIALTSNPEAPIKSLADIAIVPLVGPEVIAGSSRMKAGTAQKLVLNMLSTATMVRMGRVFSNRMVCVQLTNQKLSTRAQGIITQITSASDAVAGKALRDSGRSLPIALLMVLKRISKNEAARQLRKGTSAAQVLREALEEGKKRSLRH